MNSTVYNKKISDLDTSLFDPICSQSNEGERKCMLLLQKIVREHLQSYSYLEIGSHLGGSLQTHYADKRCKSIISIDKRPEEQPDIRGVSYLYEGNSTERMLNNLYKAYPKEDRSRIITFDQGTDTLFTQKIPSQPDLCFIDGEHTNEAAFRDFQFCLSIAKPTSIIVFHDAYFVFDGIKKAEAFLKDEKLAYSSYLLQGGIYAICFGDFIEKAQGMLLEYSRKKELFFKHSRKLLVRIQRKERVKKRWADWPSIIRLYNTVFAIEERVLLFLQRRRSS